MALIADSADRASLSIRQSDVHLGLWLVVLSHAGLSKVAHLPMDQWFLVLANTNLLVATSFLVIFHLLAEPKNPKPAGRSDYILFSGAVAALAIFGLLGSHYDVGLVMGMVALAYFVGSTALPNARFIALVYGALAINGFVAPLVFQLCKDLILIGEVYLAAVFNSLIGFDVAAQGTRLSSTSGMQLQMIGACSVYANLSFALLGFASVKAFFKQRLAKIDFAVLAGLAVVLILLNTYRLGLMTSSRAAYEYWHHGDGGLFLGGVQFALILGICVASALMARRTCEN